MKDNFENKLDTKYSFWKLLTQYVIEIPIIQRDYAQGRATENETAIRNELLESIYSSLSNKVPLDFDFVYGTVSGNVLYPLDGQQRLTTLFLLHWYIAQKENRMADAETVLRNFTYTTRTSSREFCKMLTTILITPVEGRSVSDEIRDSNEYFQEWDSDPTISAMLIMIDAIHEKFFCSQELFDNLIDNEKCYISFSYLSMEHYALTDDLYIKMNARGKALSIFENFKAKLIQHLRERNLPFQHFEEKIDGSWTDLFWDYRSKDNTIDAQFMNIFCFITEMLFLERSEPRDGDSPFKPSDIRSLIEFYSDESKVNELYDFLDMWKSKSEVSKYLNSLFSAEENKDKVRLFDGEPDIFSAIAYGKSVSLMNKILLYSVMNRILNLGKEADIAAMKDYLRIVRNLIIKTRQFNSKKFQYVQDFRFCRHGIPMVQFIDENLSWYDEDDIYNALLDVENAKINNIGQEIKKAKLIIKRPELKSVIHELEDMEVFKSSLENVIDIIANSKTKSTKIVKILRALFSGKHDTNIARALLSFEDYGINTGTTKFGPRFYYGTRNDWYAIMTHSGSTKYSLLINNFINALRSTDTTNIDDALNSIINDNLSTMEITDWRYSIVKYKECLENSPHLFDYQHIVLVKESCPNNYVILHRLNGATLNAYHMVPEYLAAYSKLGRKCYHWLTGLNSDCAGYITLQCSFSLRVFINDIGQLAISNYPDKYKNAVNYSVTQFKEHDRSQLDRVQSLTLLAEIVYDNVMALSTDK